ncbi:hypothetical protein C7C46_27965 [Streptomyces tateyamensis]|uniref:Uncharacterized protein n=1 Tax=Streptomyces tateyamensis TaxID=565073 RepID=A0A2V4MYX8_9ACTN|nr:DUF6183 family protein [Streptomyces tateyamensis]PYC69527.1 hypothetical protein C7C46_27965 [Streptomyces tateyamensis]
MSKDITSAVDALGQAEGAELDAFRVEIAARLADREFDWAGGLGAELTARIAGGEDQQGHCREMLYRVLHGLAARSEPASLRALMEVLTSPYQDNPSPDQGVSPRSLAAAVAGAGRRVEDIVPLVFDPAPANPYVHEFAACLLQELVLVVDGVDGYPALRSFAEQLLTEGHPLAVLPLRLLPEEQGLPERPAEAPALEVTAAMRQRVLDVDVTETGLPATAEAIGAAVAHWVSQSNGLLAAQEFWLAEPVAAADFPALLGLLPLTPWPEAAAAWHPATPVEVFELLFNSAQWAPAYGRGCFGAYGRLAAWHSLAALTGSPADAPPAQIAELVRRTSWLRAATTAPWFHQVAWDLAVAALRPGGQQVAFLAATDTD